MIRVREHRCNADRLSDVLNWAAFVAPEVILNKDGSFQATIRYRGPDLDSSTEEELHVKAVHINNVLRRLGTGWAIYAEAHRRISNEYPESIFPDPVSALIDETRKRAFQSNAHFESKYYLTLIHLPPADGTNKIAGFFLSSDKKQTIDYELILENFQVEIQKIADLFTRIFPEVAVLSGADLLTYLHGTISPKRHKVSIPENGMYLDDFLVDTPLLSGFFPKLGDHYLAVLGILGFPGSSQPGLLDEINHLGVEYRWVTRFISLEKVHATAEIQKIQRKWYAKRKTVATLVKELLLKEESQATDTEALQKSDDALEAINELGTDDLSYGYFTTTFVLMDRDNEALQAKTAELERVINGLGFVTRKETVNAVEAWLGSIPGNTTRNPRRPLLSSINLSHLLPGASAAWEGQIWNNHLCQSPLLVAETEGSTPFGFSTHVGDVGHTLILGPTGSGKSTLLNLMEVQFLRYEGAQVYIFDKGRSSFPLSCAVGGDHYDLGKEGGELYFQPLSSVDDESERKWAHDWLTAIAEKENVTITPEIKRSIWDALTQLASTPREHRTLHALTVYLQNRELRAAFEPFTHTGPYGRLFDNDHDNLQYAMWQCFEMEELMEVPTVIAPVLSYLFHRLEQRFDGSPTLLVLDEAWLFLDHPTFASKIREWLKTLRKQNVSVLFATQSLSDVDRSSIAPTIKEACFTKIYLPNAIALQPDASDFYRRFGLNDRQIQILAHASPKKDYYYTSPLGNRLFDLGLDELALAFCAGVTKERISLVRELRSKTKSTAEFNLAFLNHLGIEHYAQILQVHFEEFNKQQSLKEAA